MISLQEWEDVNLAWNTSEYGNVEDVRIPPSALWKPDILMYNRYAINATWSLSDTQYLACHKMSLNLSNLPDSYVLRLLVKNVVLSFRCAFWSHDRFPSPGRQGTSVQVFPRTLWILWRGFSALWTRQKTSSSPNQPERIFWGCVPIAQAHLWVDKQELVRRHFRRGCKGQDLPRIITLHWAEFAFQGYGSQIAQFRK